MPTEPNPYYEKASRKRLFEDELNQEVTSYTNEIKKLLKDLVDK